MAGAITTAEKNAAVDFLTGRISHISLHTADPGSTGTSEATGGSPAYARKAVSWSAASAGAASVTSPPTFDAPAGTYAWLGLWSASSGGTYRGKIQIPSQTLAAQGTVPLAGVTYDLNSTASA